MNATSVLVLESNSRRAEDIIRSLQNMDYSVLTADQANCSRAGRTWCAIYVGPDESAASVQPYLGRTEPREAPVLLLTSESSPHLQALKELRGVTCHTFSAPDDLKSLAETLRAHTAPTVGGRRNDRQRLVGRSTPVRELLSLIRRVSPFDSSVLILGESGTGKELVARFIHRCSPRRDKPFIAINCGAIPAELMENELFGHERGAFTGAIGASKGRFEAAQGGTLLLDEIGDMSLPMQVKLLRVLQERCFERVGSSNPIECDVRIIAATHRNLEQAIANNNFREDLYYRLNVFPVELPALRARTDDLPLLIEEFSQRLKCRGLIPAELTGEVLGVLTGYAWPGNIRELENLVERLAILFPGQPVHIMDLPDRYRGPNAHTEHEPYTAGHRVASTNISIGKQSDGVCLPDNGLDLSGYLTGIEMSLIEQALFTCDGVVAHAARLLNVQRTTLVEKMHKYHLRATVSAPLNSHTGTV